MATYKIIGGDQKEYGPVTAEEVREWIADGRLEGKSLARGENDTEWRALSTLPEFAGAFTQTGRASAPPPISMPGLDGGRAEALRKVKTPAIGLKVTAILNIVLAVWSLVRLIFFNPNVTALNSQIQEINNPQIEQFVHKVIHAAYGPLGIANVFFELGISVLILIGASKMQSLRNYEFSFAAAILAVVPCLSPCCGYAVGLTFAIWALIVLSKPAVKSHFN